LSQFEEASIGFEDATREEEETEENLFFCTKITAYEDKKSAPRYKLKLTTLIESQGFSMNHTS
jgi:hypothetical protein